MGTSACRRECHAVRSLVVCVVDEDAPTTLDRRRRRAPRGTCVGSPAPFHPP
jgi:hypothetical protein